VGLEALSWGCWQRLGSELSAALRALSLSFRFQPRKIEEIKDFLLTARRKDAKCECRGCCG